VRKELYPSKGGIWYALVCDREANLIPEEGKWIVFFTISVVIVVVDGDGSDDDDDDDIDSVCS
jgi:hypothetical protein